MAGEPSAHVAPVVWGSTLRVKELVQGLGWYAVKTGAEVGAAVPRVGRMQEERKVAAAVVAERRRVVLMVGGSAHGTGRDGTGGFERRKGRVRLRGGVGGGCA